MEEWEERSVLGQPHPLQVLVAVDNAALRERLLRLLDGRGDDVAIACNRHELESLCRTLRFDLALADLKLNYTDLGMRTLVLVDKALIPDTPIPSALSIPFEDRDLFNAMDEMALGVTPIPPSALPFSPDVALGFLDGDQELFSELIGYCLADAPLRLQELRSLIDQGNLLGVEFLAHNLKGLVGEIGAKASWQASSALERIAKSGDIRKAFRALAFVEHEVERLVKALQGYQEGLQIPSR